MQTPSRTTLDGFERISEVFEDLCRSLNTARSLTCWILFKNKEFSQLVNLEINPDTYLDQQSFFFDYVITKYLAKYKGLDTGIDKREVAIQKFKNSESSCKLTNTRLKENRLRGISKEISPRVQGVIFNAQRKIASLLYQPGPTTYVDLFDKSRWGPGVTYSLKGIDATLDRKIGEMPISVTRSALPFLKSVIEADPHWGEALFNCQIDGPFTLLDSSFNVVRGCRVTTVDKDAKTDRTIAIEPTGNVFLQLGIGRFFRKKLRRVGINLDDQTLNQRYAKVASCDNELATVDLSAASDSVSKELIYELFPVDWAILLDSIRSPEALIDGSWVRLEKFSSMGNGFTFELETLIFWALSSGVLDDLGLSGPVVVYGDDIVIPSAAMPLLREVFSALGFTINLEKTYASGYFRESCGKHYWDGNEVTPIYQKEEVTSIDSVYRGANRLLRLAYRHAEGVGWSSLFRNAVSSMIRGVKVKHYIPFYSITREGEIVAQVSDAGLMSPMRVVYQHCEVIHPFFIKVDGLIYLPKRRKALSRSLLAYSLRFQPDTPFNGEVSLRRIGRYRTKPQYFSLSLITDVAWL